MSTSENPNQAVQPGAEEAQPQAPQETTQAPAEQAQATGSSDSEQTFALKLVKRPTGDTHWNTAKGIYELVTHAETGEPSQEYALLATIDGVDVTLQTFNAGGVDTLVRAGKQTQQTQAG